MFDVSLGHRNTSLWVLVLKVYTWLLLAEKAELGLNMCMLSC